MSVPMSRRMQEGFTLIELLVAMALGLLVLAAVYAGYVGVSRTTGVGRALSQITEDASAAMVMLRQHVNAAAYSAPVAVPGSTGTAFGHKDSTSDWVHGCDADFADLSQPIASLACADHGSDALAVVYEVNEFNSITKRSGSVKVPMDCLGNSLPLVDGHYLSYSRFYLKDGALYCLGPGNASGQALVDNISDMQIVYGVSVAGGHVAASYKQAAEVSAAGAWARVVSVRVCLIVRSADAVLDAPAPYQGCDPFEKPTLPAAGDRHLYRSFTSTFVIQNRRGSAL